MKLIPIPKNSQIQTGTIVVWQGDLGGIEAAGAHDVVCVESQDVDPVSVSLECPAQGAVLGPPNLDGSVLGG